MKCPYCQSTSCPKNGHIKGRQRYRCKDCGKQFVLSTVIKPETVSENALETQFIPGGIAILLLDAENLKLDLLIENFLAGLASYPIQLKIAFANWRNQNLSKQDVELYERGYQLIHVPEGKNNADAKMIALGSCLFFMYPNVREIFVCSSDGLLNHLINQLQSQGLKIHRVRRQETKLIVENKTTGSINYYSIPEATEIPSFEGLVERIEQLLKNETNSLSERMHQLSSLSALFAERCLLSNPQSLTESSEKASSIDEPEEKKLLPENIASVEQFQKALILVLQNLTIKSKKNNISVSLLSAEFHKMYGETANTIVKKLKVGQSLTKFLQTCQPFAVTQNNKNYEVSFRNWPPKITSYLELEKALIEIIQSLTINSPGSFICISNIGSEFQKKYNRPLIKTMQELNLGSKFPKLLESSPAFKIQKQSKGYRVALTIT